MAPLQRALFEGPEFLRFGAAFLVVAALVALFVRKERRNVLRLFGLWAVSVLLRYGARVLESAGMPATAVNTDLVSALLAGIAFLSLTATVVFGVLVPALHLAPSKILRDVAVALSSLALFLWLLSLRHVDVAGIVATSTVITAVLGLSLQDVLGNVMGGLALQVDGSVAVGEWVTIGDVTGVVREIGWRQTSLETRNGDTLVVPNIQLMKSPVLVLGRNARGAPARTRRWVTVGVWTDYPPTLVLEALTQALMREPVPGVAAEPAPDVVVSAFADNWAEYSFRYWLADLWKADAVDSVLRTRIHFALRRLGIPVAIPARNLIISREEPAGHPKASPAPAERLAAVSSVPIFATLSEGEQERLAAELVFTPFAPGEAIVVQGAAVHHLYILTKGEAEVRVAVEGAPPRAVATLKAPDVFGEMGMLTGEPRKATVAALGSVDCWRLPRQAFHDILAARPAIAEEVSQILARRDVELATVRDGLSEEAARRRLAEKAGSLLSQIQRFFGIG
jgi:small-conductance mechanosensitive channel/CRP-like cAMP-binding protein